MRRNSDALLKTFTVSYYMTMSIVVSFFPLYFDALGFSKMQIGLISSSGPLVAIFSNLLWGIISDRLQTTKKTIIALLAGQMLMIVLLYQARAYPIVFTMMALFYFFQTPLNGLNDSQILLTIRQNGKSYASYRVMGSIGFAFAAVAFGVLLARQPASRTALLAVITVTVSLVLSFMLRDAREGTGQKGIDFAGFRSIFFSRGMLGFLPLILLVSMAHRSNDYFLGLYLKGMGAGKELIGLAWMTSALTEIPVFFLLSRYGHRFKELPLLALASLAYAVRFGLMSLTTSPYAVIATQLMHSVTFGIFLFTALRFLQQLVPDQFRSTGQAVYNMIWGGFAGVLSGLIGGKLFDSWGGHAVYEFAAATALLASAGFLLADRLGLAGYVTTVDKKSS